MTLRIYGDLALQNRSALKLLDASNGYSVQLKAPASLSQDTTFQLPSSLGQNNQVMVTDANGQFSFSFLADANVASNAAISLSKLAALTVSKALVSDSNGVITASAVTATEMGYLAGVTSSVQTQLDSEASARAAAVSAEESARQTADQGLQSAIDTEVSDRQAAVLAEQNAREAADEDLQDQIDSLNSDSSAAVAAEQAAREAADSNLQGQIDTEKGRVDAILLAADADKDSFAEIVSLINSVDTTNDSAFASYVLSNDAALAAETAARQSAVSSEASARQSADSTLQSNIDAEVTARQNAVSAEATARQNADTALQANIDALTVDDMTDVSTASKADGDLFQWDSSESKWKNVAPLTEASTSTVVVPGSETILTSFTATTDYNDGSGAALGTTYRPTSNVTVSKFGLKFGRTGNLTQTVTAKIYEVASQIVTGHSFSYNPANFTLLGTSTNSLSPSDIALYPAAAQMEYFTFNNVQLNQNGYYLIWVEVDGVPLGTTTVNYLAPTYAVGYFLDNHYKQSQTDAQIAGDFNLTAGYEIYTGGAGSSSTVADVGVIKTNSDGMLDDSFLGYDVDFGGHKLQGVSAPTSGTDAANKTYVDGEVSSEASARQAADSSLQSSLNQEISDRQSAVSAEASARQSAISAEQSAREAADSNLQDQIDALDSANGAALTQEISDRQAGDDALDARLDVLEGSDSTEGSVAKAEKDAKDYADSIMATEQSARQAADTTLQSNIDTEKARIDAILLASDADKDSFAEIVQLINSVDTTNDSAFAAYVLSNDAALAQEVSDRQAAVSSEQSAREAADSAMDARLDVLEGSDSTEGSVAKAEKDAKDHADSIVASEQSAREAADDAMDARLDVLEGSDTTEGSVAKAEKDAKDYTDSEVASEAAARAAADSAEQTARENADTAIYTYIDGHKFKADWVTGDGTSKTVTHSMGTKDVMIQVFDKADGSSLTMDMIRATDNTVTVTSTEAPGASGWRILILKV